MPKTSSQNPAAALASRITVKKRRPAVVGPLGRPTAEPSAINLLTDEFGALIDAAQQEVAMAASTALTTLHWRIGHRLRSEILGPRRAQFGAGIVVTVGAELGRRYGPGYGEASLRQMIRFAEAYPKPEVVSEFERRMSWGHFKELLLVADPLRRGYYSGMKGELTPGLVLREPAMLDFLGQGGARCEGSAEDLESTVVREIERFLLELGAGFSLVERRKRLRLEDGESSVDLLLFHRRLRRLVAVVLSPADVEAHPRRLEPSLLWLDQHERQPAEEHPLGILLCVQGQRVSVEYVTCGMDLSTDCWSALPPRPLLEDGLRRAVERGRRRDPSSLKS